MPIKFIASLVLVGIAISSSAQVFEDSAPLPEAAKIEAVLGGNVFHFDWGMRGKVRFQFNKNGYFFLDSDKGWKDFGKWRAEVGKLCFEPRQIEAFCSDARIHEGVLLVKSAKGDVAVYRASE